MDVRANEDSTHGRGGRVIEHKYLLGWNRKYKRDGRLTDRHDRFTAGTLIRVTSHWASSCGVCDWHGLARTRSAAADLLLDHHYSQQFKEQNSAR